MQKLEKHDQKKLFQYIWELQTEGIILIAYATHNENTSSKGTKQDIINEEEAQRMGKLKGVSDVTIVALNKVIYIELKREPKVLKSGKLSYSNSKVSKEQKQFLEAVNKSNVCVGAVCYGYDEAKSFIMQELNLDT